MVHPLSRLSRRDLPRVGGKAANLGELMRARLPLPDGFAVDTQVYRDFAAAPIVAERVAALRALPERELMDGLEARSAALQEACRRAPLPTGFEVVLEAAYRSLCPADEPVAVRSSATAEDLAEASFAGQQETFLNVRGVEAVLAAVRGCWGSLWTPRSIAYRTRQGFDHSEVALAVVVQRMVQPAVAGVLFTANPVNGRRDQLLVNASWGLGEAVVSGRVTPDGFTLARQGRELVLERHLGDKAMRILSVAEGGTREEEVGPGDRARPCLEVPDLRRLRELALQAEAHFGAPQDLEWALEGGRLFLLQARPITSLPPEPVDRSRLSRFEAFVLDDILEHFPEAPYPLDFEATVDTYEQIQHMTRDLGLAAPPASEILVSDEEGLVKVVPRGPRPGLKALALPWHWARLYRANPSQWLEAWSGEVEQRLGCLAAEDLASMSDAALAASLRAAVGLAGDIGRRRFVHAIAPMAVTGGALRGFVALARAGKVDDTQWLGGLASHTVRTEEALDVLADHLRRRPDLPESSEEWSRFLEGYGARTMRLYLPFTGRSWGEDRQALRATLQALASSERPGATTRRQEGERRLQELRERVSSRLPAFLRPAFLALLDRFRGHHLARERTVYLIERTFVHARARAEEAGRRLADRGILPGPADVVYLRLSELGALMEGRLEAEPARRWVLRRRERRPAAVAAWIAQRQPSASPASGHGLVGQPGSPGQAEGPARLVSAPHEFCKMRPGDVLVCPFTDPAWTPLFALASAVVADTGGPLSHAAIVAREYGIPAVLGVGSATRALHDGQRLRVDGDRGLVEVLPEPGEARRPPGLA